MLLSTSVGVRSILFVYLWILAANPENNMYTKTAHQSLVHDPVLHVVLVEASSACNGDHTQCVSYAEKVHKNENEEEGEEEEGSNAGESSKSCSCSFSDNDIRESNSRIAVQKDSPVLDVTGHSILVGKGFHRTMLTTVHITSKETAKKTKRREINLQNGRKVQKSESDIQLKIAPEAGMEEGEMNENKTGSEKSEVPTEREARRGNSKYARKMHEVENIRKGQLGVSNQSRPAESTRERANGKTETIFEEEEEKLRSSHEAEEEVEEEKEEEKTDLRENDKDDLSTLPLVCTITCEYTLDKIVYVDPDQTWELGLKSSTSLDADKIEKHFSHIPPSNHMAHMGTVEVLATPAVDLEAPVFAPYIPPKVRVRQTIEGVVLLPKSLAKTKCCRAAMLNSDVPKQRENGTVSGKGRIHSKPENPISPRFSPPRNKNSEGEHLHHPRTQGGKDRIPFTKEREFHRFGRSVAETEFAAYNEKVQDETNQQVDDKEILDGHDNRQENNRKYRSTHVDTPTSVCMQEKSPNTCIHDGGDFTEKESFKEAIVHVDLPLHHRYDAACSGCQGLSLHHIETPVIKVVCCSKESRERREHETNSQRQRMFHNEKSPLHAANTADIHGNCCEQIKSTGGSQRKKRSVNRESVAADTSTSHAASSNVYCISAESIATVEHDKQEAVDTRRKSASSIVDADDSKACEDPLHAKKMKKNIPESADIPYFSSDGRRNHHDAAQSDPDSRGCVRCAAAVERRENRKSVRDKAKQESYSLSLQVPVGTLEDLPWVTAVTLTTIGTLVVLTAWILSYADACVGAGGPE